MGPSLTLCYAYYHHYIVKHCACLKKKKKEKEREMRVVLFFICNWLYKICFNKLLEIVLYSFYCVYLFLGGFRSYTRKYAGTHQGARILLPVVWCVKSERLRQGVAFGSVPPQRGGQRAVGAFETFPPLCCVCASTLLSRLWDICVCSKMTGLRSLLPAVLLLLGLVTVFAQTSAPGKGRKEKEISVALTFVRI